MISSHHENLKEWSSSGFPHKSLTAKAGNWSLLGAWNALMTKNQPGSLRMEEVTGHYLEGGVMNLDEH